MKPLIRYVAKAARLSLDAFLAEHPTHVLVVEPFARPASEELGFQTLAAGELQAGSPVVMELIKRESSNAFTGMITIGRATNNDLELRYPGVSKFHAYVTTRDQRHHLTDGGSSYGTFVGDRQLEPRGAACPLESGVTLRFGGLRATYYTPADFYAFLRRELDAKPVDAN